MEVTIISKECIKPSAATPLDLKTYKVTFFDQFTGPYYYPMILFFHADVDHLRGNEERSNHLKQSLAKTLCRFYPLAGKVIDDLSIDCNDEGVCYVESRVSGCSLFDYLSHPDTRLLHKFLPSVPSMSESFVGAHVAFIQANMFDCGGMAIVLSINHIIADAAAASTFLKCWGDIARGDPGLSPDFITAPSLFPQNDAFPKQLSFGSMLRSFVKFDRSVTKRFVFDSSALDALKVKAINSSVTSPTRVEVVSALIWKCAMKAFRANTAGIPTRPSILYHAVNMRRRAEPPFPASTMGCFTGLAVAKCQVEIKSEEFGELARLVSEAKTKTKCGFLRAQGDKGFSIYCDALKEISEVFTSEASDFLGFSSWINFGLYEVDFGWGKPTWVTATGSSEEPEIFTNFVFLADTKWGNGLEALVKLGKDDMDILECDQELLEFSSLDPSQASPFT